MGNKILGTAFIILTLSLAIFPANAKQIVGYWDGAYVRLGAVQKVSVEFYIEGNEIKGTYCIPDLSIYDEPIRDLQVSVPNLQMRPRHGLFDMVIDLENGEMTGTNPRWNPPVTLHLKRARKPPRTFRTEDVSFQNGKIQLAGRLFKPLAAGRYAAVVVVHGSGEQGIRTNYYNFWGRFFAENGIAALIYDKRGVGNSSGDFRTADFHDLASDVLAGIDRLRSDKEIDAGRLGLFGISQGGWIAPLAASKSRAVKFLILNVGPAVTVEQQEMHRVEYSLRADEIEESEIRVALDYTRLLFRVAYSGKGWPDLERAGRELREKEWAETLSIAEKEESLAGWKRIRFDPAPVLRKTTVPVLALFGENDALVPPKENVALIKGYLQEAGNKDFTVKVIPNANHDMESFGTLRGGEWTWPEKYWVWPKKAADFYGTILEWSDERIRNERKIVR